MGLIGGIVQPLYAGFPVALMSPMSFLQRPLRWLEAVSKYEATTSGGPDFAYGLCVRKADAEIAAGLDLGAWRVAFSGAEPVRAETIEAFVDRFGASGFRRNAFYPCYGLAEGTLIVTGGLPEDAPVVDWDAEGQPRVGCGPAIDGGQVVIVPVGGRGPALEGAVGEIWVRGPSVAQGYWGRPDASRATFRATLPGLDSAFLRTGDLGFLRGGELFVTGRIKDLLIVRGRNLHPEDLERTLGSAHAALRPGCGAVFDGGDGEGRVTAVFEVYPDAVGDAEAVMAAMRRAIADAHSVELSGCALLAPRTIPKTSSGKIKRSQCKAAYLAGELHILARFEAREAAVGASRASAEAALLPWLVERVAALGGVAPERVMVDETLSSHGVTSAQAAALAAELEERLGRRVSPTVAYEYPSLRALADGLSGVAALRAHVKASGERVRAPRTHAAATDEPIAIVGIGCRFPGLEGPDAFFAALLEGRDVIGEAPPARRALLGEGRDLGPGGYLDAIADFDAALFRISPREAEAMDPQQRLVLETVWSALEDAGTPARALRGLRTGVFVGIASSDYPHLFDDDALVRTPYAATGGAHSIAANRVSFLFDLRGPSLAIDTACSSSLVAVHQACRSVRAGECEMAIAGGVNVILTDLWTRSLAGAGFLAADARCKPFDERADGYVRGEGVAFVVLKPWSRARADGDRVYALVRGSAINNDGHSNGLTAPSLGAQVDVVTEACRRAGVPPSSIGYAEAHGTGTKLGDPIEIEALARTLGEGRAGDAPLRVGAVKSNIGHLEAAAGIAGLVKAALVVERGVIPPTLHQERPSSAIAWEEVMVTVPASAEPFGDDSGPRRAGVSSFGFGGVNAHVILGAGAARGGAAHRPRGPGAPVRIGADGRALPRRCAGFRGRASERRRVARCVRGEHRRAAHPSCRARRGRRREPPRVRRGARAARRGAAHAEDGRHRLRLPRRGCSRLDGPRRHLRARAGIPRGRRRVRHALPGARGAFGPRRPARRPRSHDGGCRAHGAGPLRAPSRPRLAVAQLACGAGGRGRARRRRGHGRVGGKRADARASGRGGRRANAGHDGWTRRWRWGACASGRPPAPLAGVRPHPISVHAGRPGAARNRFGGRALGGGARRTRALDACDERAVAGRPHRCTRARQRRRPSCRARGCGRRLRADHALEGWRRAIGVAPCSGGALRRRPRALPAHFGDTSRRAAPLALGARDVLARHGPLRDERARRADGNLDLDVVRELHVEPDHDLDRCLHRGHVADLYSTPDRGRHLRARLERGPDGRGRATGRAVRRAGRPRRRGGALARRLEAAGAAVSHWTPDVVSLDRKVAAILEDHAPTTFVHLWSLDAPYVADAQDLLDGRLGGQDDSALRLVQALAAQKTSRARLVFATRGAQLGFGARAHGGIRPLGARPYRSPRAPGPVRGSRRPRSRPVGRRGRARFWKRTCVRTTVSRKRSSAPASGAHRGCAPSRRPRRLSRAGPTAPT